MTGRPRISIADVETGTSFTGGKAGTAAASPIRVGLVVPIQGPLAAPFYVSTAKSAVALVNERLGGVDGHPLELVGCTFGATAEQGQNCGAKFANDPQVKAVMYVGSIAGSSEFHSALGGKKVTLCSLATPIEIDVANQFCTSAGALSKDAVASYLNGELHAKDVSTLIPDDPGLRALAPSQKQVMAKQGIDLTIGFIPPQTTDVTAAILASKARSADALFLQLPQPPAYISTAKAIKQLGIEGPIVSIPSCHADSVVKALGSAPSWTYQAFGPTVEAPGSRRAEVQLFADTLKTYERRFGDGRGPFSEQLFGNVLLLAKVFGKLGPDHLTTAKIASAFEAYPGPAFLGDPKLRFGVAPMPSIGTLRVQFIQRHDDASWSQVADGAWFGPHE